MLKSILAGLLAIASTQVAAQNAPFYGNQSAPFYLTLKSSNTTLNGKYLSACHEGAGIEGFCPSSPSNSTYLQFTYNTSSYETNPTSGLLTWLLPAGNLNVSSTMQFSINSGSNVAMPLLFPGDSNPQFVNFTSEGRLGLPAYQDDTQPLPNYNSTGGQLYRWYVCKTYYGYLYQTLAWTLGKAKPQNPTCEKVEVYRVWA